MNIAHCDKGIYINFNENRVNVLVIENNKMLSDVVSELYSQSQGEEGEFVIAEGSSLYKFTNKVSLVLEPFTVSCNEKKIITALYKEIEKEALDSMYSETSDLNSIFINYMEILCSKIP